MRLTLRTMLAYLDNILEPQDAEALGAKISDSEFASELVYRTLSSTRKANLNAPPLDGKGIGPDPNSVAEYLDNTLEENRIPGFEKVCLESDMYLSEVASCHSILSICIDQPITIENEMRDRVLGLVSASLEKTDELIERQEQLKRQEQSRPTLDHLIEPKAAGAPEYIRKKPHPLWQATVIMTFIGLMSIIGLRAVGPFDQSHPWIGALFANPLEEQNADDRAADESFTEPSQDSRSLNVTSETSVQPVAVPEGLHITQQEAGSPIAKVTELNRLVFNEGEAFAELLSDSQPLLKSSNDSFTRFVAGAPVNLGDEIVSIAGFRPELLFGTGAKMTLVGATGVKTSLIDGSRLGLSIDHGKVVLQGSEKSKFNVWLSAGDTEFNLVFESDSAVAAIESVPYQLASGELSRAIRLFYSSSVKVAGIGAVDKLLESNTEEYTVFTYYPGNTSVDRISGLPLWVKGFESDSIMEEARAAFIDGLADSDELTQSLQQIYETHRLINVRRLAAYGLMEMGVTNALVGLLDDGQYRALWHEDVRLLQQYYHRDSKSRELVETIVSSYSGDNTPQVLSFLSEYDDQQLATGVADGMVQQLKSQVTVSRVIAFERLRRITGKTLLYKPESSPQRQTLSIREWEALLAEGQLTNVNPTLISTVLSP